MNRRGAALNPTAATQLGKKALVSVRRSAQSAQKVRFREIAVDKKPQTDVPRARHPWIGLVSPA